jgi:hypothetical protein
MSIESAVQHALAVPYHLLAVDELRWLAAMAAQRSVIANIGTWTGASARAIHDYGKVKEDILAWRPLLVPGGLLCGHDYSWEEWGVGVIRAVDELLPDRQVGPESIWWVQ